MRLRISSIIAVSLITAACGEKQKQERSAVSSSERTAAEVGSEEENTNNIDFGVLRKPADIGDGGYMYTIDSIRWIDANAIRVNGWTCQKFNSKAVDIRIVARPSGKSSLQVQKKASANQKTEPAVNKACGTKNVNHRFSVEIRDPKLDSTKGVSLDIRMDNNVTDYIGWLKKDRRVLEVGPHAMDAGHLFRFDFIRMVGSNQVRAAGWACQKFNSKPLDGKLVFKIKGHDKFSHSFKTNVKTEQAVNAACKTANGTSHRFDFTVTNDAFKKLDGKTRKLFGNLKTYYSAKMTLKLNNDNVKRYVGSLKGE